MHKIFGMDKINIENGQVTKGWDIKGAVPVWTQNAKQKLLKLLEEWVGSNEY